MIDPSIISKTMGFPLFSFILLEMKKKWLCGLTTLLFLISPLTYLVAEETNTPESTQQSNESGDALSLHAASAIVMDVKSGSVLYEKNADSKQYPASITKIMTLYLALNHLDDTTMLTSSNEDIDTVPRSASHIAIDYGETISVKDLEYAMMLQSANDAANVLGSGISGDLTTFAELMNTTASDLGCTNTHFANANGLHDENHYTTARDMALIMRALASNDKAREIMSTVSYTADTTNKQPQNRVFAIGFNMVKNTEFYDERVEAGKNGYTPEAGYTSVALARYNNLEVVMVVLAEPDADSRYTDFTKMMDYAFSNYKTVVIDPATIGYRDVTITDSDGMDHNIRFSMDNALNILLPFSTDESTITCEYQILDINSVDSASAKVNVLLNGQIIGSADALKQELVETSITPANEITSIEEVDIMDRLMALSLFDMVSLITLGGIIAIYLLSKFSRFTRIS